MAVIDVIVFSTQAGVCFEPPVTAEVRKEANVDVVGIAVQGPRGVPGRDAIPPKVMEHLFVELPVNTVLSGHKVLCIGADGYAVECDALNAALANSAVGISTGAHEPPTTVVQRAGVLTEPSWSFIRGPVYVGAHGGLTQNVEGLSFIQQVGVSLSPTSILVGLQPAIITEGS